MQHNSACRVEDSVKIRFDEKWERDSNGCWIWTAGMRHSGYGGFYIDSKQMGAHRASYIIHTGDIPDGMYVLHNCHVKKCVNPDHLYVGTQADNIRDAVEQIGHWGNNGPSKLTEEDVDDIRKRVTDESQVKLAHEYGVDQSMISRIKSGERR